MNAKPKGRQAPADGVRPFEILVGLLGNPVIAPGTTADPIYPADPELRALVGAPLPDVRAERQRRDTAEVLRRQQLDAQQGGK